MSHWQDQAEELIHAVEPQAATVYILGEVAAKLAGVKSSLIGSPKVAGCTGAKLDLQARELLTFLKKWRGRGQLIIVNDQTIFTACDGDRARAESICIETALHEFSHEPARFASLTIPELRAQAADHNGAIASRWHHDGHFLRASLHVGRRARSAGWAIEDERLYPSDTYGTSPTARYADALADELHRPVTGSLRDVLCQPAPDAFVSLWQSDIGMTTHPKGASDELNRKAT